MKNIYLSILLIFSLENGGLIAQSFQWAKQMGGTGDDSGNAIVLDASGNIYTVGNFQDTADFDPGSDSLNLTPLGAQDVFVSKLNATGNLLWAKNIGGANIDYGNGITVDASGNVYTIGCFLETGDFDPGADTVNLTSVGSYDIFVSKLNASGNFVWAKRMGGTGADVGTSIAIDASGNVYVTGTFQDTANFGAGSTYSLSSAGGEDIFVAKLDAAGNVTWLKQMGGILGEYVSSIALDASGDVYTTGYFGDTVDFDPDNGNFNLTSVGVIDIFISKLNSTGNFVWAKQMGGPGIDYANSIAIDGSGNVYTTGLFNDTADFNMATGTSTLTSAGNDDIFITKLNSTGSFIWAKQMGGTDFDIGSSITTDASGNVYTTGYFGGTADFNPNAGTNSLISNGSIDVFISKLSPAGNYIGSKHIGGTGSDRGNSIAMDVLDNVYTTGNFEDTTNCNTDADTFNLVSAGIHDIFIHKMGPIVTSIAEIHTDNLNLYPNPTSGEVIFETSDNQKEVIVEVHNQLGNEIMSQTFNNVFKGQFTIDAAPGIYFITIKTITNESTILKVVKL